MIVQIKSINSGVPLPDKRSTISFPAAIEATKNNPTSPNKGIKTKERIVPTRKCRNLSFAILKGRLLKILLMNLFIVPISVFVKSGHIVVSKYDHISANACTVSVFKVFTSSEEFLNITSSTQVCCC